MPRFFIAGGNVGRGVALITGSDAEHIKVLRMKIGERLVVCDGEGMEHQCRLTKLSDGVAEAEILESVASGAEPDVRCGVFAGMPKGERSDFVVQKCTETGASEIAFFPCQRCVARIDLKSRDKKILRWQRIADEAAKQAGRGKLPRVRILDSFAQMLDAAAKFELGLFMYETGERIAIKEAIRSGGDFKSAALITGPEGGFEKYEAELAQAAGLRCCSMGPRIFRCETAPLIALTAILYETDNMQ